MGNQKTSGSEGYRFYTPPAEQNGYSIVKPKGGSLVKPKGQPIAGPHTAGRRLETPEVKDSGNVSSSLEGEVQAKMENSFGQDFSNVKIYKDSGSAKDMNAKAYTKGTDIHFAPGAYHPDSKEGLALIGHELTHVVQQREGRVGPEEVHGKGLEINQDVGLEKEADEVGKLASEGKRVEVNGNASGIQRKKEDNFGATITHIVHKGETLDTIINSLFKTHNEGQIIDLRNQIILINGLTPDGAITEHTKLKIPDLSIKTKSDAESILYGNVQTDKEHQGAEFHSAPILGTNTFTSKVDGNKIRRHAFALSYDQWRVLFKTEQLDELNGYRYWAESFIKLAMGNYTLSTGEGKDGWVVYRKPNLGEITAFIKALYSPDVDLIDSYIEINNAGSIGRMLNLEGIAGFIEEYQSLAVELDSMRNLGAKDGRSSSFSIANIESFASESITVANDRDIFYSAYNGAFKSLAKGIAYVFKGDKTDENDKNKGIYENIGRDMISTSTRLIKYLLKENDKMVETNRMIQGGIIDSIIGVIPMSEALSFIKTFISDAIISSSNLEDSEKQLDKVEEILQEHINIWSLGDDAFLTSIGADIILGAFASAK
ncbi:MAG TPA: DUF4157 domain-containing protein [Cytophagaceae bacterium]|jgi:hypothetical protein|nr:DUF4157 domain-containing protein [Cytophagaceae bacterium]